MKNIKLNAEYGFKGDFNKLDEWQQKAHPYTVTLKYDRRQMTVPFFMGPALTHEPTVEDVVPCLLSDAYALDVTFEDFASEFGYDVDSRKAEKLYNQCVRNGKKLKNLFGNDFDTIASHFQEL